MKTASEPIPSAMWQPVKDAPGVHTAEYVLTNGFPVTTTAVTTRDGHTVVISPPSRPTDDMLAGLEAIGKPAALIAPNHFHFLGVPGFRERYGDIPVIAGATGHRRLAKKLGIAISRPEDIAAMLPAHVSILEPAGLRSGETWLRVEGQSGITWVVCDALFNLGRVPPGVAGLFCRAVGVTVGLKASRTFSILMVKDRRAYLAWLEDALTRDAPTGLVPGHGVHIHADPDLAARISEVIGRRLGR
ncbi:MAG TPA: hypothetical protein VFG83_11910 [Kofleriaceae bacterium]|nr:hypothetical protein [Kofleriaceae bacterium]